MHTVIHSLFYWSGLLLWAWLALVMLLALSAAAVRKLYAGPRPRRGGYVTPLVSRYTNPTTDRIPTPTGTSTGCKPDGQPWGEPVSRALQARLSSVTAPIYSGADTAGHPGRPVSTVAFERYAAEVKTTTGLSFNEETAKWDPPTGSGSYARLNDGSEWATLIGPTPCAGCPETPA